MPTLGVIPWLDVPLPEEDGVALQGAGGGDGRIAIVVAAAHREPRRVRAPRRARALRAQPGRARDRGRDRDPGNQEHAGRSRVAAHDGPGRSDRAASRGRRARARHLRRPSDPRATVRDPHGIEGGGEAPGLGLLDLVTELQQGKTTQLVRVTDSETGAQLDGYEIHHGATAAGAGATPTLSGPGGPRRLAHRQRARELRARAAGARGLPRCAARPGGNRARRHAREPRRAALGDRGAGARGGRLAAHPQPRLTPT